jgi:type IV secretion system protein VirB6
VGFFATFSAWLNGILAGYIAANTMRIASLLQPAVVTLATVYVMVWGYLQLTGKIEEPFIAGVKRIILLVVVLGGALDLWLYNDVIVDTFFNAPGQLAAGVIGAYDSVGIIDQIIFSGGDAASFLIQKGGLFNGDFSYYIAGFAIYIIVGLTAIYAMFLLALSKIALSILLALGPLFIALIFFESTKRFFEAWIAQLANYAFITILTVLVAALMMGIVASAAQQAAAEGGSITIADAVRVCMASGLTFLIMRQVMPMAAGLASGLALSSFGLVSAAVAWGFGGATRHTGQFARGFVDRETTRWDPMSRKAGFGLRRAMGAGLSTLNRAARPNTLRPTH